MRKVIESLEQLGKLYRYIETNIFDGKKFDVTIETVGEEEDCPECGGRKFKIINTQYGDEELLDAEPCPSCNGTGRKGGE